MSYQKIVTPSNQVGAVLPSYIYENYETFVGFMESAAESEERVGFGQDILQNLQKYRNFDTYQNEIVQYSHLKKPLTIEEDELQLEDGFGFPDENGVLLIGDEVILYQKREDNWFYGLQRGAAGTTVLPTLRSTGTYVKTEAAAHKSTSQVHNLSVMFLVAMLDTIHKSFAPNISSQRVDSRINRSVLLQNIKDFFASKGSKLGIQALFKMLFAENDVEVSYPGDKMLTPSNSTWSENIIMRVVPFPEEITDPTRTYTTPDKSIGAVVNYIDGSTEIILGTIICDYASAYPYESVVQYEMYVDKDNVKGSFPVNPTTKLVRDLQAVGSGNDNSDTFTITVETTVGFPDSGVLWIGSEKIAYAEKSFNQFKGCTRGYYGTDKQHATGELVYGPYYFKAEWTSFDGSIEYVSQSWPLGLVSSVDVVDPGLLHSTEDEVYINGPGTIDNREPALRSFQENLGQNLAYSTTNTVSDITYGISGVYLDEKNVYVSSSNLPGNYQIGPFSTDNSIGPLLKGENAMHVIPNRKTVSDNVTNIQKGTDAIGVFVDGTPAWSNVSTNRVVQGSITEIKVLKTGSNYINPTLLIDDVDVTSNTTLTTAGGKIDEVTVVTSANYVGGASPRITSGEGAQITISFDNYGRVVSAIIVDSGSYYKDAPSLIVVDSSNRGKGALLNATVENGSITSVEITASGIDYAPGATTVTVSPIGSGAELEAVVQYFEFDRVQEVKSNSNWMFDEGDAFMFEDSEGNRSKIGYMLSPKKLRDQLGDDGTTHSPILGWAYDGNPIYGPTAYANGVDDTDGYERQFSAWVLQDNRNNIEAGGGGIASNPPSTDTYPMGTFVQDYKFDPNNVIGGTGRILTEPYSRNASITTELNDIITTEMDVEILMEFDPSSTGITYQLQDELGNYINHQTAAPAVLGNSNGKVCNTPEFPKELFPDGVFCYFVSTYGETPTFPYIMGPQFYSRPISQNVTLIDDEGTETKATNAQSSYDDTELVFDTSKVKRYRNLSLSDTGAELEIEIADVTQGGVSEVRVENGLPATNMVGDYCFFDNTEAGGQGVEAKISHVKGKDIESAGGSEVATRLISHLQLINLGELEGTFIFVDGSRVESLSGAIGFVVSYDPTNKYLTVRTTTRQLFNFGDVISDNRGIRIIIPASYSGAVIDSYVAGAASTHVSYTSPEDSGALTPGDLWWNAENGRLYIYFKDADSSQWVSAKPIGSRSLFGALDTPTYQYDPTTQEFSTPQDQTTITISHTAPSSRGGGAQLQRGDMWWSSYSGMLYIWSGDRVADYEQGPLPFTAEWVATDPSASLSFAEGIGSESQFKDLGTAPGVTYEGDVTVIVSETSPLIMPSGDPLVPGTLWWSPISGRLYIFYTDANNSQWVATNSTGTYSTQYSIDTRIDGDGGDIPEAVSVLPEPAGQRSLWVESLNHFAVGDIVKFNMGAPGEDELDDTAIITNIVNDYNFEVDRGFSDNPKALRDGIKVTNLTRSIYRVVTSEPHGMKEGDEVRFEGSNISGDHTIIEVGRVEPATGVVSISNGEVTGVAITDPGLKYPSNFYVTFESDTGLGAYAYATVDPKGSVKAVAVIAGGRGYETPPTAVFGSFETTETFIIYTDTVYNSVEGTTYSTRSELVQGEAVYVEVTAPGIAYDTLPSITGIYKKFLDRANTHIDLVGTTVGSVDIVSGGRRYVNPIAIFTDITGAGSGAAATVSVSDGVVTGITMTNVGENYVEPVLNLVEIDGTYIPLTTDIGKIKSLRVLNPGRKITADETIKPDVQIESSFVVSFIEGSTGSFTKGQTVYQGISSFYQTNGVVTEWDQDNQIVKIARIEGEFKENEVIYNAFGTQATCILEGQPEVNLVIGARTGVIGRFIDDTSILSSTYAHIQDSEYYQRFSYEIRSPLQQIQYETFVKDIVHPTGFAMFANVIINQSVSSASAVNDVEIFLDAAGTSVPVIGLDGVDYTNDLTGLSGYTSISALGKSEEGTPD